MGRVACVRVDVDGAEGVVHVPEAATIDELRAAVRAALAGGVPPEALELCGGDADVDDHGGARGALEWLDALGMADAAVATAASEPPPRALQFHVGPRYMAQAKLAAWGWAPSEATPPLGSSVRCLQGEFDRWAATPLGRHRLARAFPGSDARTARDLHLLLYSADVMDWEVYKVAVAAGRLGPPSAVAGIARTYVHTDGSGEGLSRLEGMLRAGLCADCPLRESLDDTASVTGVPWCLLHEAATYGFDAAVRCLLVTGRADPDVADPATGATALHLAAASGHLAVMQCLIEHGAAVSGAAYATLWAPLHVAAAAGHADCVEVLVDAGADVNVRAASRETPLHAAADGGQAKAVRRLLGCAADPRAVNADGRTPRDCAARRREATGELRYLMVMNVLGSAAVRGVAPRRFRPVLPAGAGD
eukprot:TRINITY_DN3738_c0_g1_i1.p1 TRINITY_DN3738_c0_g1~~TRINITY_DN3738_c0_g1_i1.p1  ORF type:complete len:420 (+),score=54.14 TRINITY_DN3738_c0_g1_i1:583-1842(+)